MARDRKDRGATWYMARHGGSLLKFAHLTGVVRWQAAQNVLAYPKQIPDGLLDVTFAGKSEADPFLIEIATYPGKSLVDQIRRDLAMVLLTRGVIPDILVLVLKPKGNLRIDPEQSAASAHALTEFRLKVRVVNLWTVPADELLAANDVGLVPWVPLTRHNKSPRALIELCRDLIEDQAPPEEKDNMLAVTRTMVEARYNDVELLSLLGGQIMSFTTVLLETPAGKRFLAKKEREMTRKVTRKNIASLLRTRFGAVPPELPKTLRAVDNQKKLDALLQVAALCADLPSFLAAIDAT